MLQSGWYAAKSVVKHRRVENRNEKTVFEERVVLFRASSFEEAAEKAEEEIAKYVGEGQGSWYLGYMDVYRVLAPSIGDGAEVFSMSRESDLCDHDYLDRFHDTGKEFTPKLDS